MGIGRWLGPFPTLFLFILFLICSGYEWQVPAQGFLFCVTTVLRNMKEFTQHSAITRRQNRSIQRIQQHLRNYRDNPYIELTNQEITQYRWHLEAIITITFEHKIALKAIAVNKLLIKIQVYRKKHGTPNVPKRSAVSSRRNNPTPCNRPTNSQKMEKSLQTLPSNRSSPISRNQVVPSHQSSKGRRNRSLNLSLPQ